MTVKEFNPALGKTLPWQGPYEGMEALETDNAGMTPETPGYDEYVRLSGDFGADPDSGSLLISAHCPYLLDARYKTLENQLTAKGSPDDDKIPPQLKTAFENAVQDGRTGLFSVLSFSTMRPSPFFKLAKDFPQLDLEVTSVVRHQAYADRCNDLVRSKAPDLKLHFVSAGGWQEQKADLAVTNAYILYMRQEELNQFVQDVKATKPAQIVLCSSMLNQHSRGEAYYVGQVYNGYTIPIRAPAADELETLAGPEYELFARESAKISTYVDQEKAVAGVTFDNHHFRLAA